MGYEQTTLETKETRVEWSRDAGGQRLALRRGNCEALIWPESKTTWMALVGRNGAAIAHDSFAAIEDAKAWCLTRFAELRVADNEN